MCSHNSLHECPSQITAFCWPCLHFNMKKKVSSRSRVNRLQSSINTCMFRYTCYNCIHSWRYYNWWNLMYKAWVQNSQWLFCWCSVASATTRWGIGLCSFLHLLLTFPGYALNSSAVAFVWSEPCTQMLTWCNVSMWSSSLNTWKIHYDNVQFVDRNLRWRVASILYSSFQMAHKI